MPPKPKEKAAKAKYPSRNASPVTPSSSKTSKKVIPKAATSKPRIVYVVVCSYSYNYEDYLDEEVNIIGTYASLPDANSKVVDLWKNPEELVCGSLQREKARDGKEADGTTPPNSTMEIY